MTQTIRISDTLRCILLNAPKGTNLACPRDSFFESSSLSLGNAGLWKDSLAQSRNRVTLVRWDNINLKALVSARVRSGRRAWEIDHLYLPVDQSRPEQPGQHRSPDKVLPDSVSPDLVSMELLEQLVQAAAWRSAERIFLRLPDDSPVVTLARRAGFFPYLTETLLEGTGGQIHHDEKRGIDAGPDRAAEPRPRLPQDDYGLFQLFSAATPAAARVALGLTHDQWQDAQEPCRKGEEWVVENKGRISAWLSLSCHRRVLEGKAQVHPDYPDLLPQLLSLALSRPGRQRWLVPDYQEPVSDSLRYRGFREVAQYIMLIKTVAAPVMCPGMAPVEA